MIGTIFIIGISTLIVLFIIGLGLNKRTYKHDCFIIIPTGENPEDCVITRDRFKVMNKKGHYEIWFYKQNGKAYAPPHHFWTKFWKSKKAAPDENSILQTDSKTLQKAITRGAIFKKVGEREYKVAKITQEGDIQVLDHDTMELFLDDIEREKQLTTGFKDKLIQLGVWLGSLLIISLLAILILTLTMKYAGEQSAAIISTAKEAIASQAGVGA
jgi:hypothetical protein